MVSHLISICNTKKRRNLEVLFPEIVIYRDSCAEQFGNTRKDRESKYTPAHAEHV